MPECRVNRTGVVVIGRNEGARLQLCLEALVTKAQHVVYVDSGSTDLSVTMARSMGVTVVELDMQVPFTAARARNEGFHILAALASELDFVQFVDGDCEMQLGWMETGIHFLKLNPDVAIVSGRRRERYPEQSIYNRFCDFDWQLPIGETNFCGGDAMMRVDAFAQVGGFRESLIAGEEPELCVRIRQAGWKVWRLDAPMTLHDAAILRFSQWWKRTMRGGYAYTEGAFLHGGAPTRHFVRQARRIFFWGIILPAIILGGTILNPIFLASILVYPMQMFRLFLSDKAGLPIRDRCVKAVLFTLARFPEAVGQIRFLANYCFRRTGKLIEYK